MNGSSSHWLAASIMTAFAAGVEGAAASYTLCPSAAAPAGA